jgi:succinyl-CoA synthetase beta subunit
MHTCTANITHNSDIALSNGNVVVKAQVLTGGRGKGIFDSGLEGGVKIAKKYENLLTFSMSIAKEIARGMLGKKITTKQTGENGILCNKIMVSEFIPHEKEHYASVILDRHSKV